MTRRLRCMTAVLCLCAALPLAAQISIPELFAPVMDTADMLSQEQEHTLDTYLRRLSSDTGVQIVVFTLPSLGEYSIESYSLAAAEAWQLGQEGADNGALLTVALAERSIRIETGYGLEADLTDAQCGLIIRNIIAPRFQQNDYAGGIFAGVQAMASAAAGEQAAQGLAASEEIEQAMSDRRFDFSITDIITVIAIVFIVMWFNPVIGSAYTGRRFRRTGGGGFKSGGFKSGGFKGGGGRFGGGGASGSW